MKMPDKIYDVLKWVCLIALPAFAVFYYAIAKIWDLPYGPEITATINAVAVLIGSLIGLSQYAINKEAQDEKK